MVYQKGRNEASSNARGTQTCTLHVQRKTVDGGASISFEPSDWGDF